MPKLLLTLHKLYKKSLHQLSFFVVEHLWGLSFLELHTVYSSLTCSTPLSSIKHHNFTKLTIQLFLRSYVPQCKCCKWGGTQQTVSCWMKTNSLHPALFVRKCALSICKILLQTLLWNMPNFYLKLITLIRVCKSIKTKSKCTKHDMFTQI